MGAGKSRSKGGHGRAPRSCTGDPYLPLPGYLEGEGSDPPTPASTAGPWQAPPQGKGSS